MWTSKDIAYLRKHAGLGPDDLAERLGRSPAAVKRAASRHRISLRRPGSRKGIVLGQPRGVSLRSDIREDLVTGRIDPALFAERLRIDREAELCPSCAMRPITVGSTGLCRVCHLKRLTEAHREAVRGLRCPARPLEGSPGPPQGTGRRGGRGVVGPGARRARRGRAPANGLGAPAGLGAERPRRQRYLCLDPLTSREPMGVGARGDGAVRVAQQAADLLDVPAAH